MDIREERAYGVMAEAQGNLDEINRRYKRLQMMLVYRYISIAGVIAGVLFLIWAVMVWR